ncbi:preprotein translocase subunit TatA [Helicobacter enhydrae]|uniref:Sec-independent protein translocase protein TatA n=1 Tax=Helicobacter enhydrae TaxID=222136 RepID=A0A1B1U6L4_9HELI|nr:twin-arginine translocase TatA/TatE family subunit [Helicobacter enhydrae]ANV98433.1 preprotein translocase subunit TatA [Helicobacter enhydrae]
MAPSAWQIIVVLLIVVLLFGGKKIPELAKGMGSGIKNFKKAMKEDEEETAKAEVENQTPKETEAVKKTEDKNA